MPVPPHDARVRPNRGRFRSKPSDLRTVLGVGTRKRILCSSKIERARIEAFARAVRRAENTRRCRFRRLVQYAATMTESPAFYASYRALLTRLSSRAAAHTKPQFSGAPAGAQPDLPF